MSYQREFDPSNKRVEMGNPLLVTVSLVNNEAATFRGIYLSEQIHNDFSVQTVSVKINGIDVSNYQTSTGSVDDVYSDHTPYYWILETPPGYPENNPIQTGDSIAITYQLVSNQLGSYSYNKDGIFGIDGSTTEKSFYAHDAGSVIILVTDNSSNDPPAAVNDIAGTNEDTPVIINVLANDSDPDGTLTPSSVTVTGSPSNGGTNVNTTTGAITYTPTSNWHGVNTFTYTVEDNSGAVSNTATVTVTVSSVNDPPAAVNDIAGTNEDTPVIINVLANDSDPDGTLTPSSVTVTGSPSNGGTSVNTTTGAITYTPTSNWHGVNTFTYTVEDNSGAVSNTATATVTVNSVNDPPVAVNDAALTAEDTPVIINVLTNDTDADGTLTPSSVTVTGSPSNGGTSVNTTTGAITYTPTSNWHGVNTFTYTVEDNNGAVSNTATVTVTVNSVNDPPVAVNDAALTAEDTPVIINVLTNDTDADGTLTPSSVTVTGAPSNGGTNVNITTGAITYTPTSNWHGVNTFTYTVEDNNGAVSNTATVTVTVNSVNDPPAAVNDAAQTAEDTPVIINVLANDTDADGILTPSSVTVTGAPSNGGTNVNTTTGAITYTPTSNWHGVNTFTYTVEDNNGAVSNAATVTVTVNSVNDPPAAVNDEAQTDEDTPVIINVLANDTDADGTLTASSVTVTGSPSNGGTNVNTTTGAITYTPTSNWHGVNTFTYTVDDNSGSVSNTATVTVTVNSVNDPPAAVNDAAQTAEDTPVIINVLANDTDADGTLTPSSVTVTGAPSNGGTNVNTTTGAITYTPTSNWHGVNTFTYTVEDNNGAVSNAATVTVTVNSVNDPPVAVNDAALTAEDTPVIIDVLANDTDADGTLTASSVTVTGSPSNGGTSVNTTTGVITYTPTSNWHGVNTFTYTVEDNNGAVSNTAIVTVTVNSVNDPPAAVNDIAGTNEDTPVIIDVLDNDTDADGTLTPSSVTVIGSPSNGGTSVNTTTGAITYTPTSNWHGVNTFTYTVEDNSGAVSNTATVTVTVSSVNDPPAAVNDAAGTNEDTPVTINVLANDSDPDGSLTPSSVTVTGAPSNGGTSVNTTTGAITYTPTSNWHGVNTFTYTVEDNNGAVSNTATVTVTVSSVNDPPVAVNDAAGTNEDTPVIINVLANDTDADGTLTASSVTVTGSPSNGGTSVNTTTGAITYTPTSNWHGVNTFTYTVEDNSGAVSNTATVTVTVSSVNDPPAAVNDAAGTNEDTPVIINVLANDTDADGTLTPSSVTVTGAPSNGGTNVNTTTGAITYTPTSNWHGVNTFTYTVEDNSGAVSNTATVTVTVNSVNDPPAAVNDAAQTDEDTPVIINVLANDSDPDGTLTPSSVTVIGSPSNGGTSVNTTTGAITYTPTSNWHGVNTFTYTVEDNNGAVSNTATVTVTVSSVNDPPVAVNDAALTAEDTPVIIDVLANDTDADGTLTPSSVTVTGSPSNGGTSVNTTTGVITYTPTSNWHGVNTFTYTVEDNSGAVSNEATVTVAVGSVNSPPIAVNDAAQTEEDTPVIIDVLANDSDLDGNLIPSSVTVTGAPSNGGTSVNTTTGVITYTPLAEFNGTNIFAYTVEDDSGTVSTTATVTVTVKSINDPPTLINIPDIDFDEDGDFILPLNPYVTDVDHDTTEISFTSNVISAAKFINSPTNYYTRPENQAINKKSSQSITEAITIGPNDLNISINPSTHLASFSATGDSSGQFTVVFTVTDDSGATDTDTNTVVVNSANDQPTNFGLLLPIKGDTINSISNPINFVWNMSIDADNDNLLYGLRILGADRDTTIEGISDTSFIFHGNNFWQWDSTYNWTCNVNDGHIIVNSIDTFNIKFIRPAPLQVPIAPRNLRLRR